MSYAEVFHDEPPSIKYSGRCFVFGPGHTLCADYRHYDMGSILAVNDAGIYLPRLDHWFSCHGERLPDWQRLRSFTYSESYLTHGKQGTVNVEFHWPIKGHYGILGGHSAAIVAWAMFDGEIILGGIPADAGGHFYPTVVEPGWGGPYDHGQGNLLTAWEELRDTVFDGRVKSLSGNTQRILGAP